MFGGGRATQKQVPLRPDPYGLLAGLIETASADAPTGPTIRAKLQESITTARLSKSLDHREPVQHFRLICSK
jgi:hypothetical protein